MSRELTIAINTSVTAALDLGPLRQDSGNRYVLARLSAAGWDSAKLSVLVSDSEDGTFIPIAVSGTPIGATPTHLVFEQFTLPPFVRFIKLGSVNASTGAAVNQTAARTLVVIVN